ncbi:MAG TPA: BON domain-containing protein [Terriglobales bacterium]|nr:BON domain-containing protein [Terriglobales bacterium]
MGRRGFGWYNRERDRWSEEEPIGPMYEGAGETLDEDTDYASSPEGTRGQGAHRRWRDSRGEYRSPAMDNREFSGGPREQEERGGGYGQSWGQTFGAGRSRRSEGFAQSDYGEGDSGNDQQGWGQNQGRMQGDYGRRRMMQSERSRFGQGGYGFGGQDERSGQGDGGHGMSGGRHEQGSFPRSGAPRYGDAARDYDQTWPGPYAQGGFGRDRSQQFGQSHGFRSYRGRGPQGYHRSAERIREEICDRFTDDDELDASSIDVKVDQGEVRLSGHVDSREAKRLAEDLAESISGVTDVINELRVQREGRHDQGQFDRESTVAGTTGQTGTTAHVGGQTGKSGDSKESRGKRRSR